MHFFSNLLSECFSSAVPGWLGLRELAYFLLHLRIKGRKAYTTYRNHTSSQRQFKTGVLPPTLFNIYTADIPPPITPVQDIAYADHHHIYIQARVQPINTYNHTYIKFLHGQNKIISH